MRKILLLLLLLVLLCSLGWGQNIITLSSPPPAPVVSGNATVIGSLGNATYSYFIVAKYAVGNVSTVTPVTTIRNAPATPSVSNSIRLNWTQPANLTVAITYDVVRLVGIVNFPSSGACNNCLVASSVAAATLTDQLPFSSLGNYVLGSSPTTSTATELLDNGSYVLPRLLFSANGNTDMVIAPPMNLRLDLSNVTYPNGSSGITQLTGDVTAGPGAGTQPAKVVNLTNVTNASLANAGLVNSATTVNGITCTLGSTCTINAVPSSTTIESPLAISADGTTLTCPNCQLTNNNAYQANQLVAGCGVEYTTGLTFTVGTCSYTIAGVLYSSSITSLTLSAADPTNPRIDLLIVDVTGVASVITGTPGSNPQAPTIDPSTQLAITFVQVNANGTTPANVTSTLLYDEDTGGPGEWTATCSINLNCASTNNPYHLTKDIEATNAVLGNNITLVKPLAGTINLSTVNTLTFYVRSKATWPTGNGGSNAARNLSLFWLNGSTQVGTAVVVQTGTFGFNSSTLGSYQQINIPITLFSIPNGMLVTTLELKITGKNGSSSIGFYLDEVTLQGGQGNTTVPSTQMNFRGTWNSTTTYNVNDVVLSGATSYIALIANTNVTVSTISTWSPIGPSANQEIKTISAMFDGAGSPLSGTITRCASGFVSGTITQVNLIADLTGNATVDVKTVPFGSYTGPGSATSITAADIPALSSAIRYTDSTLTGWTTALPADNVVCFVLSSPSTITWLQASIKVLSN